MLLELRGQRAVGHLDAEEFEIVLVIGAGHAVGAQQGLAFDLQADHGELAVDIAKGGVARGAEAKETVGIMLDFEHGLAIEGAAGLFLRRGVSRRNRQRRRSRRHCSLELSPSASTSERAAGSAPATFPVSRARLSAATIPGISRTSLGAQQAARRTGRTNLPERPWTERKTSAFLSDIKGLCQLWKRDFGMAIALEQAFLRAAPLNRRQRFSITTDAASPFSLRALRAGVDHDAVRQISRSDRAFRGCAK